MKLDDFLIKHKKILNGAEISRRAGYGSTLINNISTSYRPLSKEAEAKITEVMREMVEDYLSIESTLEKEGE